MFFFFFFFLALVGGVGGRGKWCPFDCRLQPPSSDLYRNLLSSCRLDLRTTPVPLATALFFFLHAAAMSAASSLHAVTRRSRLFDRHDHTQCGRGCEASTRRLIDLPFFSYFSLQNIYIYIYTHIFKSRRIYIYIYNKSKNSKKLIRKIYLKT